MSIPDAPARRVARALRAALLVPRAAGAVMRRGAARRTSSAARRRRDRAVPGRRERTPRRALTDARRRRACACYDQRQRPAAAQGLDRARRARLRTPRASRRSPASAGASTARSRRDGALGTSICSGSVLMPPPVPAAVGDRRPASRRRSRPASIAGEAAQRRAAGASSCRARATLTVRATSPALTRPPPGRRPCCLVQPGHADPDAEGRVVAGRSSALTGKLTKLKVGKKGATLVVVTREASFAIALRPAG